jgi:hypothetical protein
MQLLWGEDVAQPARRLDWRRLFVVVTAMALAGAAHQAMDTSSKVDGGELFVPRSERARVSTLGFDALVSDYYWLQVIQILGAQQVGIGDRAPLVGRLLDVVTLVDPWVDHPYRFGAIWLTDSVRSVEQANALLERGVAHHPGDWRNRHYLGFNYFFFLDDQATAADWIETAVGLPGAPRYLAALAARLRTQADGLATAAAFLAQLAETTDDEYSRAEYLKSLDEIDTERRARVLDDAREEYRRRHGRDIERVEDLLVGTPPVLGTLPPAHPHLQGFGWELDDETGEIVSSFYGARYRTYESASDRARREKWKRERESAAQGEPQGTESGRA